MVAIDQESSAAIWQGDHQTGAEALWKVRNMLLHNVGTLEPLGQCHGVNAMKHGLTYQFPTYMDIEAQREELVELTVSPIVPCYRAARAMIRMMNR